MAPKKSASSSEDSGREEVSSEESEYEQEEGDQLQDSDSSSSTNDDLSKYTVKPTNAKLTLDTQKDDGLVKKPKITETEKKKGKNVGRVSASASSGRVWSEDDEIALLKGLIAYQKSNGVYCSTDKAAFYEFVKDNIQAHVSMKQLTDKIRKLKGKFSTKARTTTEEGEDPAFSKQRDSQLFHLSKQIWGSSGVDDVKAKSREGKKAVGVMDEEEEIDLEKFVSEHPYLIRSLDEAGSAGASCVLVENLWKINSEKARELNEKWKKIYKNEGEIWTRKDALMTKQMELFFPDQGGKMK